MVAAYPLISPRVSSRFTRWCTAEVESPVAFPRSVKDIRPSAARRVRMSWSRSSTQDTLAAGSLPSAAFLTWKTRPRDQATDAPRHRQPVLSRVLRGAGHGEGAGRQPGERRPGTARLREPAGHPVPADPPG